LSKDEVRVLGRELGLPEIFVGRHPFPGPASRSAAPARSPRKNSRSCATPTPYRSDPQSGTLRQDLAGAATRIINEVKGVNRVVYDITSKPPGTIDWE
jgi:GMP synthase (glutamine-hydrolysing)